MGDDQDVQRVMVVGVLVCPSSCLHDQDALQRFYELSQNGINIKKFH